MPASSGRIIAALAGTVFSLMFLYHNSIWQAFGMHFSLNWVQYNVFQLEWGPFSPEGFVIFEPNLVLPRALSGSYYGYEGTVLFTLACLILTAFYGYLYATKCKRDRTYGSVA